MMKRLLTIFLVAIMMFSAVNVVYADDISVYVDGKCLEFNTQPFISNGRTMVPMRKIFEELDAKVIWEQETKKITAVKGTTTIVLQIDNPVMYKNNVAEALDVAPVIVNGSTFVPVRAVSQSLNAQVDWDNDLRAVIIESASEPVKQSSVQTGNSQSTSSYGEVVYNGVCVYKTPTGKRYHYSAECAGKNAQEISLEKAQAIGLTGCKSCVK